MEDGGLQENHQADQCDVARKPFFSETSLIVRGKVQRAEGPRVHGDLADA